MVNKTYIRPLTLLLGIAVLQVLLPFILSLCQLYVKESQAFIIQQGEQDPSAFEQLIIAKEELKIRDGHELVYNGINYDVASIRAEHGHYVVFVLRDDRERIFTDTDVQHLTHGAIRGNEQYRVWPFVFLFYQPNVLWIPQVFPAYESTVSTHHTAMLTDGVSGVSIPPPWS